MLPLKMTEQGMISPVKKNEGGRGGGGGGGGGRRIRKTKKTIMSAEDQYH